MIIRGKKQDFTFKHSNILNYRVKSRNKQSKFKTIL